VPLPLGLSTVVLTGKLLNPDGSGASGAIDFIPSVRVLHVAESTIVLPARYSAPLVLGAFSIVLPAGDDGNPSGWTYLVKERVRSGATPYSISVLLANGATQDLSVLAPVASDTGTPVVVGPRGPRGFEVVIVDNLDGSVTLTIDEALALVDNPDGTATLNLAA